MVWNTASICTFTYAKHSELWYTICGNMNSYTKPQINQNIAYMNSY